MSMILIGLVILVLVLIGLIVHVIVAVVRVLLAVFGAVAFAAVLAVMLGSDPVKDPQSFLIMFVVGLLPALWLAFELLPSRNDAPGRRISGVREALPGFVNMPRPLLEVNANLLGQLEAAGRVRRWTGQRGREAAVSRKLGIAWSILEQVAEAHRARIAVAKNGCERLLALAGDHVVSPSVLDALIAIRKGVPELTESCVRHMMNVADASGRSQVISLAVETLERIAARAEREADTLAQDHAVEFDLTRNHLRRRSSEDRLTI
jgi:hypothetical protein